MIREKNKSIVLLTKSYCRWTLQPEDDYHRKTEERTRYKTSRNLCAAVTRTDFSNYRHLLAIVSNPIRAVLKRFHLEWLVDFAIHQQQMTWLNGQLTDWQQILQRPPHVSGLLRPSSLMTGANIQRETIPIFVNVEKIVRLRRQESIILDWVSRASLELNSFVAHVDKIYRNDAIVFLFLRFSLC